MRKKIPAGLKELKRLGQILRDIQRLRIRTAIRERGMPIGIQEPCSRRIKRIENSVRTQVADALKKMKKDGIIVKEVDENKMFKEMEEEIAQELLIDEEAMKAINLEKAVEYNLAPKGRYRSGLCEYCEERTLVMYREDHGGYLCPECHIYLYLIRGPLEL